MSDTTAPQSTRPNVAGNGTAGSGSRLALIVSIGALAVSLLTWWQVRTDLASLRQDQQQLAADLGAGRDRAIIDIGGAPAIGSETAAVTLIEYSDYECPFCIRHFTSTMPQLLEDYVRTGRVRYVFKDFPIDQLHPEAKLAHVAARCAGEQGKFWELHARLFGEPGSHTPAALESAAGSAGVADLDAFRTCLTSGRMQPLVDESVRQAFDLGASGTPSFFVGISRPDSTEVEVLHAISGAHPFPVFQEAIEAVEAAAHP